MKKELKCPSCKNKFEINSEKLAGKYTNCVHCQKKIFVFTDENPNKNVVDPKNFDKHLKKTVDL